MVVAGTITEDGATGEKLGSDAGTQVVHRDGFLCHLGDFIETLSDGAGIDIRSCRSMFMLPGCPPNPEALMAGMLRLQEKVRLQRAGKWTQKKRGLRRPR